MALNPTKICGHFKYLIVIIVIKPERWTRVWDYIISKNVKPLQQKTADNKEGKLQELIIKSIHYQDFILLK